jgi:hypothetical protein
VFAAFVERFFDSIGQIRLWPVRAHGCHSAALARFSKADIESARAFDHNGEAVIRNRTPRGKQLMRHKLAGRRNSNLASPMFARLLQAKNRTR